MNPIVEAILAREGEQYTNLPADKGGPTKYGITQATLAAYRNAQVSATDVQNLTRDEAAAIYEKLYVAPFSRFSGYPKLMDLIVDSAVQHGVSHVQLWLQTIPSTDPDVNYRLLLKQRIKFYGTILVNPSQAVFAKGWMNRIAEFVR